MEGVESPAARKEQVSLNNSFVILDVLRREEDVDGAHRSDAEFPRTVLLTSVPASGELRIIVIFDEGNNFIITCKYLQVQ